MLCFLCPQWVDVILQSMHYNLTQKKVLGSNPHPAAQDLSVWSLDVLLVFAWVSHKHTPKRKNNHVKVVRSGWFKVLALTTI